MATVEAPRITSARAALRIFVREQIEGQDEINTEQLISAAIARFANDEEFIVAALRELISQLVPQLVSTEMTARRDEYVVTSVGAVSLRHLEETASERLNKVFENTGGQYRKFLDMTRPELLRTARYRERRAASELRWSQFEREIAGLLPNDNLTVGDALTSRQLAELLRKHFPKPVD